MATSPEPQQVRTLLRQLFTPLEFQFFLMDGDREQELLPLLYTKEGPTEGFFEQAVAGLQRLGLLTPAFGERLKEARPARAQDIDSVFAAAPATPHNPRVVLRLEEGISDAELQRLLRSVMEVTPNVTIEIIKVA